MAISDLQSEADRIMNQEGKSVGVTFTTEYQYFLDHVGEDGVQKIEAAMAELGYPFDFSELDTEQWYREGYVALAILVGMELFDWDEDDVYEIGYTATSMSKVLNTAVSFISVKRALRNAPRLWSRHFDFGELETINHDEEAQTATIRIYDYDFGDHMHAYYCGYFSHMTEILTGSEDQSVVCRYRECESPEGYTHCDEYHFDWSNG